MTANILADAFGHHVWASIRLLDACADLDDEQLATNVPGTYGSIIQTLRHIVGGDVFYLDVLRGGEPDPSTSRQRHPDPAGGHGGPRCGLAGPDRGRPRSRDRRGRVRGRWLRDTCPAWHPPRPGPLPRDRSPQPGLHGVDEPRNAAAGDRGLGLRPPDNRFFTIESPAPADPLT